MRTYNFSRIALVFAALYAASSTAEIKYVDLINNKTKPDTSKMEKQIKVEARNETGSVEDKSETTRIHRYKKIENGETITVEERIETVRVPIDQATQHSDKPLPKKGMQATDVRAQFGDPLSISDPVGNPPITRWTYTDFVAVFEHDHVVHAIAR